MGKPNAKVLAMLALAAILVLSVSGNTANAQWRYYGGYGYQPYGYYHPGPYVGNWYDPGGYGYQPGYGGYGYGPGYGYGFYYPRFQAGYGYGRSFSARDFGFGPGAVIDFLR
ncbi:MAG: hypothetical protein HUU20_20480 [Pirellulales bacterium]|nr:hypothetical protein [Pirellulales bacterium]